MAFWSKSSPKKESAKEIVVAAVPEVLPAEPVERKPSAPSTHDPTLDAVLDLAAGMLRDYGRTALDLEKVTSSTIHEWCDNWAEHLLIGAPKPGDQTRTVPLERRDFAGARRFFGERRREETAFVGRTLDALQKAVWAFIQTLDGMSSADDGDGGKLQRELERLKSVAQGGSAELLRKEVLETVEQIGQLAQARQRELSQKLDGLSQQVRTLCNELEVARIESSTDELTRVFNRKALQERVGQAASMCRLFGQTSSLLRVDIDGLKTINQQFGMPVGDSALREVADRLVRTFRVKTEFVARASEDEFAVLLWDTPLAQARAAAEKVLAAVRAGRLLHEGTPVPVSVSIGVTQIKPGESVGDWIDRTGRALQAAQQQGRDRVAVDEG